MIEGERTEFDAKLAVLFAGIDKPLTEAAKEAFWRGLARMSLVEFNRCVDLLLRELEEVEGPAPRYTVASIWQAKTRLRARAPQSLADLVKQHELAWEGDQWDLRANARLLKHIVAQTFCRGIHLGPDQVRRLVAAKNAWAADMRDLDDHGADGVRRDIQNRCWSDLIAHAQIAKEAA